MRPIAASRAEEQKLYHSSKRFAGNTVKRSTLAGEKRTCEEGCGDAQRMTGQHFSGGCCPAVADHL